MPSKTLTKLTDAARKAAKAKKRQPVNHVILVLDKSGSMTVVATEAKNAFANQVAAIQSAADNEGQLVNISTIQFNDVIDPPISNFSPAQYRTMGATNLYGAIVKAIEHADSSRQNGDTALVIVITDGEHNYRDTPLTKVRDVIGNAMQDENFSIIGNAPPGGKDSLVNLGIPAANVTEWEASRQGLVELEEKTVGGITGYFNTLSSGGTMRAATASYTANMHGLTPKDVAKMADVSNQFRRWRITSANDGQMISDFVNGKGIVYAAGRAFYQLTKSEKVSAGKILVVLDSQTGAIYSGDDARRKLGLPLNKEIRVKPGTSGEFTLFIQSTSYNRKLVGGTTLLYLV